MLYISLYKIDRKFVAELQEKFRAISEGVQLYLSISATTADVLPVLDYLEYGTVCLPSIKRICSVAYAASALRVTGMIEELDSIMTEMPLSPEIARCALALGLPKTLKNLDCGVIAGHGFPVEALGYRNPERRAMTAVKWLNNNAGAEADLDTFLYYIDHDSKNRHDMAIEVKNIAVRFAHGIAWQQAKLDAGREVNQMSFNGYALIETIPKCSYMMGIARVINEAIVKDETAGPRSGPVGIEKINMNLIPLKKSAIQALWAHRSSIMRICGLYNARVPRMASYKEYVDGCWNFFNEELRIDIDYSSLYKLLHTVPGKKFRVH